MQKNKVATKSSSFYSSNIHRHMQPNSKECVWQTGNGMEFHFVNSNKLKSFISSDGFHHARNAVHGYGKICSTGDDDSVLENYSDNCQANNRSGTETNIGYCDYLVKQRRRKGSCHTNCQTFDSTSCFAGDFAMNADDLGWEMLDFNQVAEMYSENTASSWSIANYMYRKEEEAINYRLWKQRKEMKQKSKGYNKFLRSKYCTAHKNFRQPLSNELNKASESSKHADRSNLIPSIQEDTLVNSPKLCLLNAGSPKNMINELLLSSTANRDDVNSECMTPFYTDFGNKNAIVILQNELNYTVDTDDSLSTNCDSPDDSNENFNYVDHFKGYVQESGICTECRKDGDMLLQCSNSSENGKMNGKGNSIYTHLKSGCISYISGLAIHKQVIRLLERKKAVTK